MGEIRELMGQGKFREAAARCEDVLKGEPGNFEVKMLYGTCCQLAGDEKTFREVYDSLSPELDSREKGGERSELISHWTKYRQAFRYVTVAGAVFAASAVLCGCYGVPSYYAHADRSWNEEMPVLPPGTDYDAISCEEKLPANAYRIVETRGKGRWARLQIERNNLDGRDFAILKIVRGDKEIGAGMVVGRDCGNVWMEVYDPEKAGVHVGCGALPKHKR